MHRRFHFHCSDLLLPWQRLMRGACEAVAFPQWRSAGRGACTYKCAASQRSVPSRVCLAGRFDPASVALPGVRVMVPRGNDLDCYPVLGGSYLSALCCRCRSLLAATTQSRCPSRARLEPPPLPRGMRMSACVSCGMSTTTTSWGAKTHSACFPRATRRHC